MPRRRRLRPERRRGSDVVLAALLIVLLVGGATALWRVSPAANTTSRVAGAPLVAPAPATGIPDRFVEAWRAPSAVSTAPIVAGPAAVTADGTTVVGRDAATGVEGWSYTRDRPLCAAASAFPAADDRLGRVLALYQGGAGFCSEMTALRPDTGARVAARNPDVMPGTRLLADDTFLLATGERYLEIVRSDLVRTLEYGVVTAPAQPGRQPRAGCRYGSAALAARRVGVIERCPAEPTDRLTVLTPDPKDSEKPEEEFSVSLPATGATIVAMSTERVAVAFPNPARLQVFDRSGLAVGEFALDVPDAELATDPPGGVADVRAEAGSPDPVSWWTGSRTIALDPVDLAPRWTLVGTLGPAQPYGGGLLVPVPNGLLEVDPGNGATGRAIPVLRADPSAPVRLASAGLMLLEQRGPDVVALRPAP